MPSLPLNSPTLLAQTTLTPGVWLLFGLLIVLALVGGIIIFAVRRRVLDDRDENSEAHSGFMGSLDQMLRKGEITQEEYDRTKRRVVERTLENLEKKKAAERDDGQPPRS